MYVRGEVYASYVVVVTTAVCVCVCVRGGGGGEGGRVCSVIVHMPIVVT